MQQENQGVQVENDLYALFAYCLKIYMQFNSINQLTNCTFCGILYADTEE